MGAKTKELRPRELFEEIRDQARVDRALEEADGRTEQQALARLMARGIDVDAARAKLEAAIAKVEAEARRKRPKRG